MKTILIALLLAAASSTALAADVDSYYASLGTSSRIGSASVSLSTKISDSFYVEASFIDEGKQPDGIKNINRIVNINLVKTAQFDALYFSARAGVTSSYFSHNGSGDGYDNHTGFVGQNIGLSVGYNFSSDVSVELSDTDSRYLQCDHKAYEAFNVVSVGVSYRF